MDQTESVRGFVETKKDKIEKRIAWGLVHLKKGSIEDERELERLMGRAYRALDKGYLKTAQRHLNTARKYAHEHNLLVSGNRLSQDFQSPTTNGNSSTEAGNDQEWLGEQLEQFGGFRQHFQQILQPPVRARAYPRNQYVPLSSNVPHPATPEEIDELMKAFNLVCSKCDELKRKYPDGRLAKPLCDRCQQLGEKVFPRYNPLDRPLPAVPYQAPRNLLQFPEGRYQNPW